MLDNQSLT